MVQMAVVQIKNIAYMIKFLDRFIGGESRVASWYGRDRYVAEYMIAGRSARLVAEYSGNTVTIWFEPELFAPILKAFLSHEGHLRKAVFIGAVDLSLKGRFEGFIVAPWGGRVKILKLARGGLWLGTDGHSTFFASNLEGLAELVEFLEGSS